MRASTLALVCSVTFLLAGCDEGSAWYYDRYPGVPYYDYCGQFTSCQQCTPIYGCGWCSYGQGQGFCFSEPNLCRTDQFSWTWEPEGCGFDFDAGAAQPADAAEGDAAGRAPSDAAAGKAADAAVRDAAAPDAADRDASTD